MQIIKQKKTIKKYVILHSCKEKIEFSLQNFLMFFLKIFNNTFRSQGNFQ
jgi:hypothetical protein